MGREFKNLSFTSIKADSEGRTRKGIAAVFGNIDSWGDRIQPGAFKKTISEGSKRVRHLWNHDSRTPPIATIVSMKECSRDELPEEVLVKAPDATGGLVVEREYYNNDLANWVLEAVDKGDVNEMSFAFETVKSQYVEEDIPGTEKSHEVRELLELKLFDTSDVNWGMNMATVAVGAKKLTEPMPIGSIYSNLLAISEQIRSGKNLSDSEMELIEKIYSLDLNPKTLETPETIEDEPEPDNTTPLSDDWLKVQKAKLLTFNF